MIDWENDEEPSEQEKQEKRRFNLNALMILGLLTLAAFALSAAEPLLKRAFTAF